MPVTPVQGIDQVNAAFKRAGETVENQKKVWLTVAAEPVRRDAETLAIAGIRNITLPWSRMRIGVTKRSVYVVPRKRSTKIPARKRPAFADLMLTTAMEPALERNKEQITQTVDEFLDDMAKAF